MCEPSDSVKICNCNQSKTELKCKISQTLCCWCLDLREECMVTKFVDGIGLLGTKYIPRDIDYCALCRQTKDSFSILVDNLTSNMTEIKSKEIKNHMKDLAKRQFRRSPQYLDSRLKIYLNMS